MKFSGSPKRNGENRATEERVRSRTMNPTRSLVIKNGCIGIFLGAEDSPKGLFEPVWWRNKI